MQLIYKIEFNSTNSYFKYLITTFIKEFDIQATCKQFEGFILIIIDDEVQKIENFFKFLEENLPLSIFLGKTEVVQSYDNSLKEIEDKGIKQNLKLLTNSIIEDIIKQNNIDFMNDIEKILKGETSRLDSRNGLKKFYLPNRQKREKAEAKGYEVKLLITEIPKIEELFEISTKDLQLLCSIERPLVKLKFKEDKNLDSEYSSTNYIYVKLPDDKETVLFCDALKRNGIYSILYTSDEVYQDGIRVTYFKDRNLIVRGEKALFPKFDFNLDKKFNSSTDYFEAIGGVYKSVLAQNNKRIVPSIGVYFSLNSQDSNVCINIPASGVKSVIKIPNVYNDLQNCFEEISQLDENAKRLISNYKNRYPSLDYDLNQNTNGFKSIINICAKVLGLKDEREFKNTALQFRGQKGLLVDMKLANLNGVNYLDYRKIVRSMMSYKMADVENTTLAFSFYESLSWFISSCVDEIVKDLKVKDIALCGDMFANKILLTKTYKILSKDYNILLPIEYPLDYNLA